MPRQPKPWRRADVGNAWYAWVDRKRVWLAPPEATKAQAREALIAVLAARGRVKPKADLTVREAVILYLADVERRAERGEVTPKAWQTYRSLLRPFSKALGKRLVSELRPADVVTWMDGQAGWGQSTRHYVVGILRACFKWAVKMGHVSINPATDVPRPPMRQREVVLTREQASALIGRERDPTFRDLLRALLWTGCRPNEVYSMTADRVDLDGEVWRVLNKTRKKTGKNYRPVYLNDEALTLTRRLMKENPAGPLFRNRWGNAWQKGTVARKLKELGGEAVAYSFRHLFATDLLEAGVPPHTVAELMGHEDSAMITKIYNQLRHRKGHLRDAVRKAGQKSS